VVAPVPWFPFKSERFGSYSRYARVKKNKIRQGVNCFYPRYPVIPKIGMTVAPILLAIAAYPMLKKIRDDGYDFDLIDAHYFYPDGVAAILLGKCFAKPVAITARGSDINVIPDYSLPRKMIRWAAKKSAAIITVSGALRDRLLDLGVESSKINVLRNGVDLQLFAPMPREQIRSQFKLSRPTLLSVGNLIELKGHHLVIEALCELPEFELLIIGDGEQKRYLSQLVIDLGLSDRVRFIAPVKHAKLIEYYNAADILVLASSREGLPNVVLEAMACGTPVVATDVGGIPEVVLAPEAGEVMQQRDSSEIVRAVRLIQENPASRQKTRQYAEQYSWTETATGQLRLFYNMVS